MSKVVFEQQVFQIRHLPDLMLICLAYPQRCEHMAEWLEEDASAKILVVSGFLLHSQGHMVSRLTSF